MSCGPQDLSRASRLDGATMFQATQSPAPVLNGLLYVPALPKVEQRDKLHLLQPKLPVSRGTSATPKEEQMHQPPTNRHENAKAAQLRVKVADLPAGTEMRNLKEMKSAAAQAAVQSLEPRPKCVMICYGVSVCLHHWLTPPYAHGVFPYATHVEALTPPFARGVFACAQVDMTLLLLNMYTEVLDAADLDSTVQASLRATSCGSQENAFECCSGVNLVVSRTLRRGCV